MARLAKLPNIVGVKDGTNDLTRPASKMRVEIGADFALLSAEDATAVALPRPGRGWLHFGHRQCRAATLLGNARGVAARRFQNGA